LWTNNRTEKFPGIPVKARKKVMYISESFTFSPKPSTKMNSPLDYRGVSAQMVRALGLRITVPSALTCKYLPVWP